MAGDVGFAERVIGPTVGEAATAAPVLHEYGPRMRLALATGPAAEGASRGSIRRH
jgi:hypothetical protein